MIFTVLTGLLGIFALVCFVAGLFRSKSEGILAAAFIVGLLIAIYCAMLWYAAHWYPAPGTAGVIIKQSDDATLVFALFLNALIGFAPLVLWFIGAWINKMLTRPRHRQFC